MSDREQRTHQTYKNIAPEYAAAECNPNSWIDIFYKFQKHTPRGAVLDLGCGHSRDAALFVPAGYQYVGIDSCRELLSIGQKNHPQAALAEMNMYQLCLKDAAFDGVWATGSLLHIPKNRLKNALDEVYRVMKTGGTLFAAVKQGLGEKMLQGVYRQERLYTLYNPEEFRERLSESGFKVFFDAENHKDLNPPHDMSIWLVYLATKK